MGKISKSRGGGPIPPLEMIERYSADAVRYWASSTSPGKDAVISEEKIQAGARLITKLWNVARFSELFLAGYVLAPTPPGGLTPADRWILSRLQSVVRRVTGLLEDYDYAAAKSEIEMFFWRELADNYLEMAKQRLYESAGQAHEAACYTLYHLLHTLLKLLAPFLPFVTEEIYQGIFANGGGSIHTSSWPEADPLLESEQAEAAGEALVEIATAARRYKSENNLSLGFELDRLQLAAEDPDILEALKLAHADLMSVTRARQVEILSQAPAEFAKIGQREDLHMRIQR